MIVLTVLGALLVVLLLWAERSRRELRPVAKLGASAGFVVVGLLAGAADSAYGRWVLAALVLSAAGDAALLSRAARPFLIGLASFLLAHVAYVAAFTVRGVSLIALLSAMVVLAVPVVVVVRWLWPRVSVPLRAPVVTYAVVITVMVAAAFGTAVDTTTVAIPTAAVAFYLSDLAVARDRFVVPGFANKLWGLPLYYAAQYVFAWST